VPNLNEFFSKEKIQPPEIERFGGKKPCSKCDKDAEEYFLECIFFNHDLGMSKWSCKFI